MDFTLFPYFYLFFSLFFLSRIAMADVDRLLEDTTKFSDASITPVFQLKDLTNMYKKQMVRRGASAEETEKAHATLFKGEILD